MLQFLEFYRHYRLKKKRIKIIKGLTLKLGAKNRNMIINIRLAILRLLKIKVQF